MQQMFAVYLKQHGHSATRQRLALLTHLQHSHQATCKQLIQALAGKADQASVYRSLACLQNIGAITAQNRGGEKLYELSDELGDHHHHLRCTKCGNVESFNDPGLEAAIEKTARQSGYARPSHQLEINGVCPSCR